MATRYKIEIFVETDDVDPSELLDLAIEWGQHLAKEAEDDYGRLVVDAGEVSVISIGEGSL